MIEIKLIENLIITFLKDLELKIRMQNVKDSENRILKLKYKLECEEERYKALLKENIKWCEMARGDTREGS